MWREFSYKMWLPPAGTPSGFHSRKSGKISEISPYWDRWHFALASSKCDLGRYVLNNCKRNDGKTAEWEPKGSYRLPLESSCWLRMCCKHSLLWQEHCPGQPWVISNCIKKSRQGYHSCPRKVWGQGWRSHVQWFPLVELMCRHLVHSSPGSI